MGITRPRPDGGVIINGPRIAGMCGPLKLVSKCFKSVFSLLLPQCAHECFKTRFVYQNSIQ